MMKTEILFKFVAIRAPQTDETRTSSQITFDGRVWIDRITGLVNDNVSLNDARTRLSNDFMDSSAYVLRARTWQPFLTAQTQIQNLLHDVDSAANFKSSFKQLFVKQIDPNFTSLEKFVDSEQFTQFKEALWHSYYSNVALINRRPQDRPLLEFWLRLWHFLEQLHAGESFESLIQNFNTWQFVVPNQLIKTAKTTEEAESTVSNNINDASATLSNKIAETKKSIAQLQATHKKIIKVFHTKLAEAAAKTVEEETSEIKPIANSGSLKKRMNAPWMLTAQDIGNDAAVTLEHLGISLIKYDATQIDTLLERREAELENELFALEYTERIVLVRGVPVRVRRRNLANDKTQS
ncbi:TPA: hypothetical protein I8034_002642 [Legionella pneumophila]|nr:hypothetical protein [Legionella pneumophila subsp. fraseri]HAT1773244.1 hypothetical protein [Legionella pneumophila]MDX1847452.1 hypothetical protein [Legionella pneumophila subsp. fraseri]HAT2128030.1 hypothetical protein [Legionella pneumophila]HAT2137146.1 hypothetical protein [Legionella pneumophila]